ncbi:MAG: hypothetical protein K2X93_26515 [Candidatus Obscuribacterales bacterium]|nr:hypothetical protein [Candidatus Obscuribacterales bacterium]
MPNSHRNLLASLILMLALCLLCSAPCRAESNQAEPIPKNGAVRTDAPFLQGASCGTIGPQGTDTGSPMLSPELSPMLPGATNGTIGPPGLDATYVVGVQEHHDLPFVPFFLFGTLALSVAAWGLRLIVRKKKAPMWVLGIVAGSVIMMLGLAWHLLEAKTTGSLLYPAVLRR